LGKGGSGSSGTLGNASKIPRSKLGLKMERAVADVAAEVAEEVV
jgi:hypothetical protein